MDPNEDRYMELPAVQLEIVDLLKEIKELLKFRNDQLQSTQSAYSGRGSELHSERDAVEKSTSQSHPEGSPRSQSPLYSASDDEEDYGLEASSDRQCLDDTCTTTYYELNLPLEWLTYHMVYELIKPVYPVETAMQSALIAGAQWKYCKPIVQGLPDGSNGVKQYSFHGRGRPDYMPEWEIIQVAGEWYHIDGTKLSPEIEFSPDAAFEEEERLIPYSMCPSKAQRRPARWESIPILKDQHKLLEECLGNLHCAPAHTIRLKFEKSRLREAEILGTFSQHLRNTRAFLDLLEYYGGNMEIVDLDGQGQLVVYNHQRQDNRSEEYHWYQAPTGDSDPRMLMTEAALFAEQFILQVPPVRCKLQRRVGEPAVIVQRGTARWYRIIHLQGLAAIIDLKSDQPTDRRKIGCKEALDLIFDTIGVVGDGLRDMYDLHVSCRSRSEADNAFESKWAPFHITWFRIKSCKGWPEFSNWKFGRLYGTSTSQDDRYVEEVAFTMCFFPSFEDYELISDNLSFNFSALDDPEFWYWSILVLTPTHFKTFGKGPRFRLATDYGGHLSPLGLLLEALRDAADSWEAIADHIARLVNQRDAIFDPDLHDRLLFDDDAFSRSRLYFWAIDSLAQFIPALAANIREWEIFWKARRIFFDLASDHNKKLEDPSMRDKRFYEKVVRQIEDEVTRLRAFKARLEVLREQIKTLRDGLFNASAVIESRAATELGQNVKLLTYVSIVYLPLSFCAAAWSIDYSYHSTAFVVVTVLLSTTTYLTVMNLNNLARLSRRVYQQYRTEVIRSMSKDSEWVSLGEQYNRFRPQRETDTPSEWYLVVFLISQLWKQMRDGMENVLKLLPKKQTDKIAGDSSAADGIARIPTTQDFSEHDALGNRREDSPAIV